MNATGVLSAQPVAASGAVRVGRRSMAGLGRSTVGAFHGNTRQLKARAVMGRRAAMPMGIRAEKVVGIDLGTTNSAVRPRARAPPRVSARPSLSGVSRRSTRRGIRARFLQGSGFRFGAASRSRRARTRPRSGRPPRARARRASRGIRRAIRGARRSEPSPLHPFYPLGLLLPPTADIPRILTSAAPIRPPPAPRPRSPPWRVAPPPSSRTPRAVAPPPPSSPTPRTATDSSARCAPLPKLHVATRFIRSPRAEGRGKRPSSAFQPSAPVAPPPAPPRARPANARRSEGPRDARRTTTPTPESRDPPHARARGRAPSRAGPPRTDRRGDVDDRARRRATPPSGRGERFSFPADRARAPHLNPPFLARSRRCR